MNKVFGLVREKKLETECICPYCNGNGILPNISNFFRILRKDAGLTQKEFANLSGYSRTQIQMVEVGKRNPTNNLIQSYLDLKNDSIWKLNKVWKDTR